MKQLLTIFGANLRDQSKGQFVVHAAGCADCKKLARETRDDFTAASLLEVSEYIWSDIIAEGSMTAMDGLQEIHFAPCVTLPMAAFPEATAPLDAVPAPPTFAEALHASPALMPALHSWQPPASAPAPEPVAATYTSAELDAIAPTVRTAVRDEAKRKHAALVRKVRRAKARYDELELELLRVEAEIDRNRA